MILIKFWYGGVNFEQARSFQLGFLLEFTLDFVSINFCYQYQKLTNYSAHTKTSHLHSFITISDVAEINLSFLQTFDISFFAQNKKISRLLSISFISINNFVLHNNLFFARSFVRCYVFAKNFNINS